MGAAERFFECIRKSQERGGEWLSSEDVLIFSTYFAKTRKWWFYIMIPDGLGENVTRLWVQGQLESAGAQEGGKS